MVNVYEEYVSLDVDNQTHAYCASVLSLHFCSQLAYSLVA